MLNRIYWLLSVLILLAGCEQQTNTNTQQLREQVDSSVTSAEPIEEVRFVNHYKSPKSSIKYDAIEWIELIPESDLDALLNPPDYIIEVQDGSIEDQIASTMQNTIDSKSDLNNSYEQALISTTIIESMDQRNITIPGFVVPVEFNEEQAMVSFFLVPFFGACLHMPPPPPNQIIYVESELGVMLHSIYEPVMISGKLATELFEDQIATSAYTMVLDSIAPYDEGP